MSPSARAVMKRQYGMPFRGLVTTALRHEVPVNSLTGDSRNVLVRPGRVADLTKIQRRQGSTFLGAAETGLLEMVVADATMTGKQMFEHKSASVTDGYPILGVLFGDESKRYGQYWFRDTNGPTDYTLGEEYSTTHYPIAASTVGNWKVVPIPYDGNGATGLTRLTYEDVRRRMCAGSRSTRQVGNWRSSPGFLSCPSKWNGLYNHASGSGSQKMRISPAGHCPPLWAPNFPAASYPTRKATSAPWTEGDKFFASCMFEWEDGSFSMPFIPRDINTTLTGGLGLVTVDDDADGTVEYFDYIPWRNIPIGPNGVVRVWLLRTPKVSKTLVTAGSWPSIADLQIVGSVPNGVTSYDDPAGNDASLLDDPSRVRFDHKWPDRARHSWTFDQRMAFGYLRPNPCAIILTCTGSASSRDLNGDDSANPGSVFFHTRVYLSGATYELHLRKTSAGVTTTTAITLSTSVSLQSVVDQINATVFGGSGGEWAAQLVPGVDGTLPSTYLAYQSQGIVCATNSTTTVTSAGLFADVAEGMKVTGTDIPAGAYVVSKASNSSLTISAAATGTSAPTLTFAVDTGDGGIVSATDTGNVRAYNGAYYVVLPFKQTYLDTFNTAPRDFIVTAGGPDHAANAGQSFYTAVGNRRSAPSAAGVLMGGAPLRDGCVVFYSKRIFWYRNARAGGSGEDADYRLVELEQSRGCTSSTSIVEGNGWVGCFTDDGFWAFDGEKVAILTGDVLDRDADGGFLGELAYEAAASSLAASLDSTTLPGMHAHFRDGKLWLNYRTAASSYAYLCYDCTPSVESAGLGQVLTPDGNPYGWSTRLTYNWRGTGDVAAGIIGSLAGSGGMKMFGCDDRNDKTRCGLIQQFEIDGSWLDGVAGVQCLAYGVTDLCGTLKKKVPVRLTALYEYSTNDAGSSDVLGLTIYTRQDRTANFARALPRTPSSGVFSRKVLEVPMSGRGAAESFEFRFSFGSNPDTTSCRIAGLELEYEELDSLT